MKAVSTFLCSAFLLRTSSCFSSSIHPAARKSKRRRHEKIQSFLQATGVHVRDWGTGEGTTILKFLLGAEDGSFNPEGSLELDCKTESLLKESYDPEDGGCFVVAEKDNTIVGVAGLIVGTPVEYKSSGSSMSYAQTTAAIRRCCAMTSSASDLTLTQLLTTLEERAIEAQATQVIALAYQSTSNNKNVHKPTPELLEELGYQILPQQLPGVDAVQCGKDLSTELTPASTLQHSS